METLSRGLLSGFIVGIVCVAYVLFRFWRIESRLSENELENLRSDIFGNSWLLMAFLGSASLVWGVIGASIFRFLENQAMFLTLSIAAALFASVTLYIKDVTYKFDKIVLTLIITLGLGFLIPYII